MNYLDCPIPLLGFSAFSGTGKTTLLTKLIPYLASQGIRLAVIKHAHHNFDIDHPEKDSYKLRHAGATQMLISSSRRWALMHELESQEKEYSLMQLLDQLDYNHSDLVLVEGFKKEPITKIELHRPSLGHPLLCKQDSNIIAVASDEQLTLPDHIIQLEINQPEAIGTFIIEHFHLA